MLNLSAYIYRVMQNTTRGMCVLLISDCMHACKCVRVCVKYIIPFAQHYNSHMPHVRMLTDAFDMVILEKLYINAL